MSERVSRRDFLKGASLVALGTAAASTLGPAKAKAAGLTDLAVKRGGKPNYEVDDTVYRRFNESRNAFNRLYAGMPPFEGGRERWEVSNPQKHMAAGDEGYTHLDYALAKACESTGDRLSYAGTTYNYRGESKGYSFADMEPAPLLSRPRFEAPPADMSRYVKRAAKLLGASLVGIAKLNKRWLYSDVMMADLQQTKPMEFPPEMQWVVVIAIEMEYEAINTSPTVVASATVGKAYSDMASVALSVAEFIKALGYRAAATGNDTALSVPLAIDAGLGEFGRNGLLITPEYGPRVRLCKVITDLPLEPDQPIQFGVHDFCRVCMKCAETCPADAISTAEEMSWSGPSQSNNPGVRKWYVDVDKCLNFWADNGRDCANCIASCPYNKPGPFWHHQVAVGLAPVLGSAFVGLDDALGYGQQKSAREWWEKKA